MTSYQRRLRDIEYYKQCVRELEEVALGLAQILKKNNIKVPLFSKGVSGTDFITYYNSEEFISKLMGR